MIRARFKSMRFRIPRLGGGVRDSLEAPELGLCVSPSGGIEMVDGDESVRQAVLLLLATRPGERVMRPEYGCDLHRLMFAPNDDTTAGLAKHYVERALARWEPRIQVLNVDANRVDEDPGRLDIQLEYRVRATQRTERLTVPVNLLGENP